MKLYIIGPSGAGKTYLGKKLSAATGVPVTSLDDLFWNNTSFTKRDPAQRDALLSEVLRRDSWILEGVQHAWLGEAFRQADGIILLEFPVLLCRVRIVRRFFHRKRTGTARKNETFRALVDLLAWTKKFYRVNLPEIHRELEPYSEKVTVIGSKRQMKEYIEKWEK